ncbi:MAG: CRTAC1 family protein, partial [Gemmataceae bacterium]|nr:CRTAC1 family protein [Gemmataceae bacterium]
SAPTFFRNVTPGSGVDFTYRNGEEAGHYAILESLGGGIGLIDYNGDGLLDLFITGGGYFSGPDKKAIKGHPNKMYQNLGHWKFQDVTAAVGLEPLRFYTHGAAVGDYNNDGWPDLLVTGWGRLALFRNEPDNQAGRRFVEVTQQAGLTDDLWSTSAAWGDLDGDGFADLYVCHYVNWSWDNHPKCTGYSSPEDVDVCPPKRFDALPHTLYHNNRDGTFTAVSQAAGLRSDRPDKDYGRGLGVLLVDVNGDRKPDIYVANDTSDNFLYLNHSTPGKLRFEEVGLKSGVARDDLGGPNGSMGVDAADYDGSGLPSLWVTNYENEMHALYRSEGNGVFLFNTTASGIAAMGRSYVGFGTGFVDVDNDGWEDLVIANGHVIHHAPGGLKQPPVLLRNQGRGRFRVITPQGGAYFQERHVGRGLALGDLDNDGWPDLVISHSNEPVVLLGNEAPRAAKVRHHWLGVELVGRERRDVVGAKLTVEAGGRRLTRFTKGGGSYLSSSDRRLLFGLGTATRIDRLTVTWSWGQEQSWDGDQLASDRYHRLVE